MKTDVIEASVERLTMEWLLHCGLGYVVLVVILALCFVAVFMSKQNGSD